MPKTPAEAPQASPVSMEQRNVFRSAVDLIVGVVIRGQRNSITGLASQFAYNAFIATVPLLLLVIAAVSLVGGKDAPDRIVSTYEAQIPEAYQEALRQVLTDAVVDQNRAALFIIAGAIGALYLVGNAVGALMQGMDRARGVPHRTWLHTKIVGIKFAAIWAVLMTMVNALLLVGQDLINWATDRWNLQNDARGSLLDILFPAVALLLMVMLWVLYRYGPHAPVGDCSRCCRASWWPRSGSSGSLSSSGSTSSTSPACRSTAVLSAWSST